MADKGMTPSARSRLWNGLCLWGPPAVLSVGIFTLSSIPGNRFPSHPEILNLVVHFLEFFLLGFLLARALSPGRGKTPWQSLVLVLLLCGGLGLLDELYQFSVPLRVFDPVDILYDVCGAFAGSMLYLFLRARRKFQRGGARE